MQAVPAQCVAGMGSHGVVYNGTAYRTLDDAPPEGDGDGAPNGGCQRIGAGWNDDRTEYDRGEPNWLPLPPGYTLAPGPSIDWDSDCHPRRYIRGGHAGNRDLTDSWPECSGSDTIAAIAAHGWSTECAVTTDGALWGELHAR